MPQVISIAPNNPFENPTTVLVNGPYTLPVGTRYLVRATATNSVSTITVPATRSFLIQNEGSFAFSVATTGNSTVTVNPGNQLQAAWDDSQSKHEIQLTSNTAGSVKQVSFLTYTITQNDKNTLGATITTANAYSSVLVFSGGVLLGPLDYLWTASTGVMSWANMGYAGICQVGEVLQIIAIAA